MVTITINLPNGSERHLCFDLPGRGGIYPETIAEEIGIVLSALRQAEVLWQVSEIKQRPT